MTWEAQILVNYMNGQGLPVPSFYDLPVDTAYTLIAVQNDLELEAMDNAAE
jgi:hypothetical protein